MTAGWADETASIAGALSVIEANTAPLSGTGAVIRCRAMVADIADG